MFVKSELFCAVAVKAARIRMKDRMFLFIILFDTKMLFYRDALCGQAKILFKHAHRGITFTVMLRCGRGVCGTTRVDVNRATCPSAQGSV